ncbi:unnamed protein product [Calypogeia fissa]
MSKLTVRKLTPAIGAVVEGISLAEPLQDEEIAAISEALLENQVIFFHNQSINPVQQHSFAKRFGELHVHPVYPGVSDLPEIMILDTDGDHPPDNDNWHTDVTFIETPPMGTILSAKQLPPTGGDTLWASCSAAYEALSPPIQTLLLGLKAEHNFLKSFPSPRQWRDSHDPVARWEEARKNHPPVVHPVVRTHPESGRKGLFVSAGFTTRILGLHKTESDALLNFLFAHQTKPEFTLRWTWSVNDLAFWDNRITQHYAVNDYVPHRRVMNRATVLGDKPF